MTGPSVWSFLQTSLLAASASAEPVPRTRAASVSPKAPYDVQGHRGGRGHTVENTLPSFAWGLINGATSLELDNGITKDGHVVVWHDEDVQAIKCKDTGPAFPNDPSYPYVGKYIANLTLAQVKTLDCGSERQSGFPLQTVYPGTRISTLDEFFQFLSCADPAARADLNIESKVDAEYPNRTRAPEDFVRLQYAQFERTTYFANGLRTRPRNGTLSGRAPYYGLGRITFQSFDWRTLALMKTLDREGRLTLSALVDGTTTYGPDNSTSPWLANLTLPSFPGPGDDRRVAQAAASLIGSHPGGAILSSDSVAPSSNTSDPARPGFVAFTTEAMVKEAAVHGLGVKPWTVETLDDVVRLVGYGASGIITDYPHDVRRWAQYEAGLEVAPRHSKTLVLQCLKRYNQVDSHSYSNRTTSG